MGILYWNQFADESEVKNAEAKIYSTNGPKKMRWKSSTGKYNNGPKKSVTKLLTESLVNGLPNFKGSELRITGHSLGNQLAITVSHKLNKMVLKKQLTANYRPSRVALLDPFYSKGAKSYLNSKWPGEIARNQVNHLKKSGVVIEAYRSSLVTTTFLTGDENKGLMNSVAFVQLKPWNFKSWQVEKKHGAAVINYFWGFNFSPRELSSKSVDAASSASSRATIRKWMLADKGLIQDQGQWTISPKDDKFKKIKRL